MKKTFNILAILILASLVLSACQLGGSTPATATPATSVPATSMPATASPTATQVVSSPTATLVVATQAVTTKPATSVPGTDAFSGYAACPYKGTGSSQPEKLDTLTFKLPDGRNVYAIDLSKLPGCAIVFEGRLPWQTVDPNVANVLTYVGSKNWDPWDVHLIIDIRSYLGNFNPTSYNKEVGVPDQYQSWFVYSEGSIWFYDPTWNISDYKTVKPSIAEELESKKFNDAMTPGGYVYPRIIVQPSGKMDVWFKSVSSQQAYQNGEAAGCTKTDQPEFIPVYGLYDGTQFSAAIGAGGCRMVYWADGSTTPITWARYQKDGKEIVTYTTSVVAYTFPSGWSDNQVNTWISAHPGGK